MRNQKYRSCSLDKAQKFQNLANAFVTGFQSYYIPGNATYSCVSLLTFRLLVCQLLKLPIHNMGLAMTKESLTDLCDLLFQANPHILDLA